jgi:hypothetical protein
LKDVGAAGAFFATSVPSRVLAKFVSVVFVCVCVCVIDSLYFISDTNAARYAGTVNFRMFLNSELARIEQEAGKNCS